MLQEINLYVDDIRKCPEWFVVAMNYDEAIGLLSNNNINILLLDHDLGIDEHGVEKNGYDIVKYICEHGISPNKIYIHTELSITWYVFKFN